MRAIVVVTGRMLTPFMEPPRTAAYAARTVGDAIDDALARRNITVQLVDASELVPVSDSNEPTLVLADHTFLSDRCLGDFLVAALDVVSEAPARLALCRTPSVEFMLPVSSCVVEPLDVQGVGAKPSKPSRQDALATERVLFDAFVVDSKHIPQDVRAGAWLADLRATARAVVVSKREIAIPLRLPVIGDAARKQSTLPLSSTVACHIEHWCHILWLNHVAFGIRWFEIARGNMPWAAWRGVLAFPWTMPRLLGSFVHKGRNVRIHPTALVEASILGDDVVIGARASVRNSIVGNGVEVGDHATVLSSSLGDRTYVTPRTFVVWSTSYADATLSNYKLQVSVVGRGSSVSTWAGLIDAKLQGEIEVHHEGALRSTGRSFMGSCVGHDAHVGAKVLLLPGREVPSGAFIAMRPDELVVHVPRDVPAGVPLVRDHGTLIPLR
jgi:hypothetical protein